MTKPWERDLTPETGIGEDNKNDTWLFQDVDEAVAIVLAEAGPEWAALFKAAPNMARALMGPSGKGHHHYNPQHDEYACQQCAHFAPAHSDGCEFGKALRKAGVIP